MAKLRDVLSAIAESAPEAIEAFGEGQTIGQKRTTQQLKVIEFLDKVQRAEDTRIDDAIKRETSLLTLQKKRKES